MQKFKETLKVDVVTQLQKIIIFNDNRILLI